MTDSDDKTRLNSLHGTALSVELSRRGLTYLADNTELQISEPLSSELLVAGLAQHEDARFHMALIALFLYQSQLETAVLPALSLLDEPAQLRLKLFYTAAALLQIVHKHSLHQYTRFHSLPLYFIDSFSLDTFEPPAVQLKQLGLCHRELTGMNANWLGTYCHAADRLLTRLEKEASWAIA